jgi:hypothetical protein
VPAARPPSADAYLAGVHVDGHRPVAREPPPTPGRLRAPEQSRDPVAELRVGDRLPDHVIAAALEQPHPVQPVGAAAHDNHRDIRIGNPGDASPARTVSSSSSVPPSISTTTRSGCMVESSASALARSGATSTR